MEHRTVTRIYSAPRQPLTASPLPLPSASRAGAGRQPVPAPGHGPARLGSARNVTSRVTASRWPRRGDVTRGRDHRPPALPPGPYPIVFHSSESAGVLGPLRGPRALTQRSPRTGRFAAMRVQPREAHRRRGLAQPPSLGRAKDEEELRARVLGGVLLCPGQAVAGEVLAKTRCMLLPSSC